MSQQVDLAVGDRVFRKTDLNKRFVIGIIIVLTSKKAWVAWEDKTRINGSGTHRSYLSRANLVLATEEEIARRLALRLKRMTAPKH